LLLAACGLDPSAAPSARRVLQVETVTAAVEDVEVVLEPWASRGERKAEIRPQVDGTVAEVLYREGARVARDELLVRLDDARAVAKLDLARAALDSAKARLPRRAAPGRGRQLIAQDLISRKPSISSASTLAAMAAVREQSSGRHLGGSRARRLHHIRAPSTDASALSTSSFYVQKAMRSSLMKTDPVESSSTARSECRATADRHRGPVSPPPSKTTLEGAISFVNPRVDPNTRMLDLKARVANPDDLLLDGQFVEVSLLLDVRKARSIPRKADAQRQLVYPSRNVARERSVAGMRLPPRIEVPGVAAGEFRHRQHRLHTESGGSPGRRRTAGRNARVPARASSSSPRCSRSPARVRRGRLRAPAGAGFPTSSSIVSVTTVSRREPRSSRPRSLRSKRSHPHRGHRHHRVGLDSRSATSRVPEL
jgi:membrane fusion protein (multidrug efflux system)